MTNLTYSNHVCFASQFYKKKYIKCILWAKIKSLLEAYHWHPTPRDPFFLLRLYVPSLLRGSWFFPFFSLHNGWILCSRTVYLYFCPCRCSWSLPDSLQSTPLAKFLIFCMLPKNEGCLLSDVWWSSRWSSQVKLIAYFIIYIMFTIIYYFIRSIFLEWNSISHPT